MSDRQLTIDGYQSANAHPSPDEVPPGYKQTDVGVIPEDWDVKALRSFTLSHNSGIFKRQALYGQGCNIVGVSDIYDIDMVDGQSFANVPLSSQELAKHTLNSNDLLYAESSLVREGIARTVYVTERGAGTVFAWHTRRYSVEQQMLLSSYLYYYLQSIPARKYMISQSIQTAITGINTVAYFNCPIITPPLPEQHAIAAALSDVDGLIGALDALIEKKQAIKQAAMQQLLTGKKRLPGFVGEWKTKRLRDIITFLPTANNPRADLNDSGEIQYIHYGDVHAQAEPVLDCNVCALPYIDRRKIGNAAYLEDGDLIIVDASEDLEGTGKSVEIQGVMGKDVVAGLHTILCRGNPDQWARGYKAYLQFIPAFKLALTRIVTGISVYAISKKQFAEIELALPPVSEQDAIVSILSDMDAGIAALERRREKTEQIKQGMMQQLITGRIRLPALN